MRRGKGVCPPRGGRSARALLGAGGALLLLLAGCGAVGGGPEAGGSEQDSFAQVVVSLERNAARAEDPPQVAASAHFVRHGQLEPVDVAALLGLPAFARDDLPAGECRLLRPADDIDRALSRVPTGGDPLGAEAGPALSLLDAGELELRGPSGHTALWPRDFPSLLGLVQGFAYFGREPAGAAADAAALLIGPEEWTVSSLGGDAVGSFQVSAQTPAPLVLEQVGGVGVAGSSPASIDPRTDLELRWQGSSAEVLHVELVGAEVQAHCRVPDTGRFVIPARLVRPVASGRTVLALTRVSRTPFAARGLVNGELLVALRTRLALEAGATP